MTAPWGRAYVEVLADTKKFPRDLYTQMQKGVDEASGRTRWDEFEQGAGKAGERAGKNLEQGVEKGVDGRRGQLRKAGERSGEAFGGGFLSRLSAIMFSRGGLYAALGLAAGGLGSYASGALPAFLAAVPALATAAAGGIGTLVLSLHGFTAAIGAGVSGDTAAWEAALVKLAPAAQSVAKEIVGLTGVFKQAQMAVQQQFFLPLQGSFQQLARSLIPIVRTQLAGLAGTFGGLGASLLGGLSSKAGAGALATIFDQLNKGLVPFVPLMSKAVELFLRVGAVAAPFISAISGDLADSLTKFLVNLDKSLGNGGVLQFFKTAGSVLGAFGTTLGSILRLVETVFGGISDTGPVTLILLKDVADLLTNVLGPAMPGIAALLTAVGGGLGDIVEHFTPGALAVGQAIGSVFVAWAPFLKQMLDALLPLIDNASRWLTEGGPKLADVFIRLGQDAFPLILQVLQELTPVWDELGKVIIAWVDNVLPELPGLLDQVFKILFAMLPILPPLVDLLVQLLDFFAQIMPYLPPFIELFAQIAGIVAFNVGWISQLLGWLLKLVDLIAGFSVAGMVSQFAGVADIVSTLTGGVEKLLTKLGLLDQKQSKLYRLPGAGTGGSGGTVPKAYANSGLVTRPTVAMIGEQAPTIPEAVIRMGDAEQATNDARNTGLLDLIGTAARGGAPSVQVRVFVGDREITDIVRVEVDQAFDDQARDLDHGPRET